MGPVRTGPVANTGFNTGFVAECPSMKEKNLALDLSWPAFQIYTCGDW